jgi:large subunit ribosomal protein L15
MKLHDIESPNKKTRKRVGRGEGSGLGQQSGRGHKGQKSVSGNSRKRAFEGGQMPLVRRIPKFGFKNPFRVAYVGLNLDAISRLIEDGKITGTLGLEEIVSLGLASKTERVKILGRGELKGTVAISAHAVTASAKEKIEAAGSTISIIE